MKTFFLGAIVLGCLISGALAQTAPPAAPAAPVAGNAAPAAASAGGGKRAACQTAAQGVQGQDRRDQMQLCLAQARVDCLKQAIEQKVIGPQRRDFVKSCVGVDGRREHGKSGSDKSGSDSTDD